MKIRRIFKVIGYSFLAFLVFFVSNGFYENIYLHMEIQEFMKKGVYDTCEYIGTTRVEYYKVSRGTYEEKGYETYYRPSINNGYLGSSGDILLNKKSPFEGIPFVYEFISFFFGGHAASPLGLETSDGIYNGEATMVIEAAGNNEDGQNIVREIPNNWVTSRRRRETIGVRVKGLTEQESYQYIEQLKKKEGEPYNFSFLFNTKKSHYCTDLIDKCYREVNKKYALNDFFYTSVNDLILSKKTYIFLYKVQINDVMQIYYIE